MEKKREKAVKKEKVVEKKEKAVEKKEKIITPEKKERVIEKKEKIIHPEIREERIEVKVEKVLLENFVALQQVMTNLAVKFDNLSGQISKLLELFEISAKTLAEKNYSAEEKEDKRVVEKLDSLIEQNKVLARGITLLHEKDSEKQYPSSQPMQRFPAYTPQKLPTESQNPKFNDINA
jgi:hypothetical protein